MVVPLMPARLIPKVTSTVPWGPTTCVMAEPTVRAVEVPSALTRVSGTDPVMAVWPEGAAAEAVGVMLWVTVAAVRLRRRTVTVEPVRPKSRR